MGALVKLDGVLLHVQSRNSLQTNIANIFIVPRQKIPSEDQLAVQSGARWTTGDRTIQVLL